VLLGFRLLCSSGPFFFKVGFLIEFFKLGSLFWKLGSFSRVDAEMPNTGATLSGVLEKQSDVFKKWNPRFFSLDVRNPRTLRGRSVVMYLRAHTCVDVPEDSQLQGPHLKYWRGEEASGKEAGDTERVLHLHQCKAVRHDRLLDART
jgi:hypothetical protein